jgi:DNA-directed RNA polymerase subunit F
MENNLLHDNNLNLYVILIASGLILGCSLYYIIKNNYTAYPSKNMEPVTNEEIEAILNENENITTISNENIDKFLTDSDLETDIESDPDTSFDSQSILSDIDITDLDLFFMPNVDLEVCDISELKFFEISSIYSKEIEANGITEDQLRRIIE